MGGAVPFAAPARMLTCVEILCVALLVCSSNCMRLQSTLQPLRVAGHAQQSASHSERRGDSARRSLLHHRGCAARGLGGVEQVSGRKTHLSLYPKR